MTSPAALRFLEVNREGERRLAFAPEQLVIAGWTGRDRNDVEQHIRELEALGVARPATVPTFYEASPRLLTQEECIEVDGRRSSGEVECVLLVDGDLCWIGIGSDHTDREIERQSVALSKRACPKPISTCLWPYQDIADHWDRLELSCHVTRGGKHILYQQGPVAALLSPPDLFSRYQAEHPEAHRLIMFCGTLSVMGQIEHADRYELELFDPILDRRLQHAYSVQDS